MVVIVFIVTMVVGDGNGDHSIDGGDVDLNGLAMVM